LGGRRDDGRYSSQRPNDWASLIVLMKCIMRIWASTSNSVWPYRIHGIDGVFLDSFSGELEKSHARLVSSMRSPLDWGLAVVNGLTFCHHSPVH
jgi:hypothetical protein